MLGATVVPVATGSATLKDAINEAMRDWCAGGGRRKGERETEGGREGDERKEGARSEGVPIVLP